MNITTQIKNLSCRNLFEERRVYYKSIKLWIIFLFLTLITLTFTSYYLTREQVVHLIHYLLLFCDNGLS